MFFLRTDASKKGISAMLSQFDDDGHERIVALVSRCLTNHELNYTITELELLAIVYGVVKLQKFLIGKAFKIITDHIALTFLLKTTFYNSRLSRWSALLQNFVYEISYIKGSENKVADFFSRVTGGEFENAENKEYKIAKVKRAGKKENELNKKKNLDEIRNKGIINKILVKRIKDLPELQQRDVKIREVFNKLEKGEIIENYVIKKKLLFHKTKNYENWRVIIPEKIKNTIIDNIHEELGHAGVQKSEKQIERNFYWRGMKKEIKQRIKSCDLCQRTKHLNITMEGKFKSIIVQNQNELISVDFYGPLPKSKGGLKYIFVVKDNFSKLITLYPIKKANTRTCLNKLITRYFKEKGKPNRILSDHGTQFTSAVWKNELAAEGVEICFSSIRHPQSNPVERTMRELGRMLKAYC